MASAAMKSKSMTHSMDAVAVSPLLDSIASELLSRWPRANSDLARFVAKEMISLGDRLGKGLITARYRDSRERAIDGMLKLNHGHNLTGDDGAEGRAHGPAGSFRELSDKLREGSITPGEFVYRIDMVEGLRRLNRKTG